MKRNPLFLLLAPALLAAWPALAPAREPARLPTPPAPPAGRNVLHQPAASPAHRPEDAPGAKGSRAERAPLTAEERALLPIQEESRLKVEALVKQIAGLRDGPARHALERAVETVKRDCRARLLLARARLARARGDLALAREAEAAAHLLLHPRPLAPDPTLRQLPDRSVVKEGGQR